MSTFKSETKNSFDLISRNYREPGFCRICLVVKKRIVPLMAQLESEKLIEVFSSVTGIEISTKDQLPQQICFHCKKILLECHLFRNKCLQSDSILKTVILKNIKDEQMDTGCSDNSQVKYEDNFEASDAIIKPEKGQTDTIECTELEAKLLSIRSSTKSQVQDKPTSTNSDTKNIILSDKDTTVDLKPLETPLKEDNQYMQERKLHSCTECQQSFRSAKSLKIHFKVHHTVNSSLSCGHCQESFECDKDLKLHTSLHDKGPPWKCVECDKEFFVKYKFRRHTLRHMSGKRHKCEECGKSFSEHYALVRHARSHSSLPQPKNYACHLCDKRYLQRCGLRGHLVSHSAARPCVCATCGKRFATARLLSSHSRTHTDDKPYKCDNCNKTFRHSSTLCAHRRTHTGERPYVCACCGKSFLQNSNLTLHMRTHTGEKPYACSVCSRQFSSRSSLTLHERRHAGHKPYVCNICGKRFVGADIALHIRRHTGARTHACGACPRLFYTKTALADHANRHAGIKPFECALCQKKMTTKSHLVKHLKTHENKKIKQTKQQAVTNKITDIIPYNCTEEVVIAQEETYHIADKGDPQNIVVNQEDPHNIVDNQDNPHNIVDNQENPYNIVDNQDTIVITFEREDTHEIPEHNINTPEENVTSVTAVNSDGFSVVKLYQVDQSLQQISRSGDQVSISNITHTVTANFD